MECNVQKMREALCDIVLLTVKAGMSISCDVACGIIASKAKHALKQSPRNCDNYDNKTDVSQTGSSQQRLSGKEKPMEASDRKELRVILDNINVLNDEWFDTFQTDEGQTCIHDALEDEIIKADKILAKRPRNRDVGTPEERLHRYHELCREISKRHERIGECAPLTAFPTAFEWEDRPYEEGGTNEQG